MATGQQGSSPLGNHSAKRKSLKSQLSKLATGSTWDADAQGLGASRKLGREH